MLGLMNSDALHNPLAAYFENNQSRVIHKWTHYFDIYDRHFAKHRGRAPVVLEVGVSHGGSLHMWRDYFGREARIIGVDKDSRCLELREDGFEILIGSQASPRFWADTRARLPRIDVLIDDGGHRMDQQRVTFQEMFPYLTDEGVYICEDLMTSYKERWGGGYRRPSTFVEYAKGLVDDLNGWFSAEPGVSDLTQMMHSIHFYPAALVVERHHGKPPTSRKTGAITLRGD